MKEGSSATSWYDGAVRLSSRGRDREAWACVCKALESDPLNVDALVMAADEWRVHADSIGFPDHSDKEAAAVALGYCDTALDLEPAHADAWGIKAHALLTLERPGEALAAAERGLGVLPQRVGAGMAKWPYPECPYPDEDEKYILVAEELYDAQLRALVALNRAGEAKKRLDEALQLLPNRNAYLEELIQDVEAAAENEKVN